MRGVPACAWALAALALLSGCDSPRPTTSVLVEVDSDLRVGSELTELRIQVFDRAGIEQLSERNIALTTETGRPAQYTLPASFALSPTDRRVRDCRLVVTGRGTLDSGSVIDLVERQAIAVFVDGEQSRLAIRLSRSCVAQLCRGPMDSRTALTCVEGACAALTESALDSALTLDSESAAEPAFERDQVDQLDQTPARHVVEIDNTQPLELSP